MRRARNVRRNVGEHSRGSFGILVKPKTRRQMVADARAAVLRAPKVCLGIGERRKAKQMGKTASKKHAKLAAVRREAVKSIPARKHPADKMILDICKEQPILKTAADVLYAWLDKYEFDSEVRAKGINKTIVVVRIGVLVEAGLILKKK